MSSQAHLARPYAQACFDCALDLGEHALPLYDNMLQSLCACMQLPELQHVLANPAIDNHRLTPLFIEVVEQQLQQAAAPKDVLVTLLRQAESLLGLLADYARFSVLPEIQQIYAEQVATYQRQQPVTVTTAQALNSDTQQMLSKALQSYYAGNIAVDFAEEKGLIGGLRARQHDHVLDASIIDQFEKLKSHLLAESE